MRLHQLEIQAFGPFADRQSVDFDALSSQGLFLLNGPTGAGKSSVLDAVCFALYGSVPGARQAAKRLRSDHADASLAPEVSLEFSVAARRYRVVRSPAWERPARRGGGTTKEQARTLLSERIGTDWVQKSARNDEVGLELQAVLGMDKEQFTKVVMLPQGEFAAFLRADAKPRRELLQRLFSTTRFEELERLFAEESQRTSRGLADQQGRQRQVYLRAVDEAQRHDLGAGEGAGDPGSATEWSESIGWMTAALAARRDTATAESTELAEQSALADGALAELGRRRRRFEALDRLRRQRSEHEAGAGEIAAMKELLRRHDQAQGLSVLLQLDQDAASLVDRAGSRKELMLDRLRRNAAAGEYLDRDAVGTSITGDIDEDGLAEACRESSSALAVLRAALPDEQQLRDVRSRCASAVVELRDLDARLEATDSTIAELQCQRAVDSRQVEPLRLAADGILHLRAGLTAATEIEETVRRHAAADDRRRAAEIQHTEAAERFLTLKQEWLDVLQLRLEQAAEELAEQLEEGQPCPVCGSDVHPSPTSSPGGARVTLDEERAARRAQSDAETELQAIRELRDRARLDVADLRARGGDTAPEEAAASAAAARRRLLDAEAADAQRVVLDERIRRATAQEEESSALRDTLRADRAAAEGRRSSLVEQELVLSERLSALAGDAPTLSVRIDEVQSAHDDLERVLESVGALLRAESTLDENRERLDDALAGSPFSSAADARAALLPKDRHESVQRAVRDYDVRGHRLDAAWDDDGIREGLREEEEGEAPPSDDDERLAAAAAADLRGRAQRAGISAEVLGHSVTQLHAYDRQLAELEKEVAPLREHAMVAAAIAEAARGGGDNIYKMSLATYVLASRLEQVAAAATERLLQMTDGRYQLVHSDATSGNKRSGLGLNVIDGWTGNSRDTSTLSGGESFMASLALALGLADVVQQEAGGLDIETLFVDEGFGSLDDQALEQVMDALEGLRSGGRVVGLVSHVPELKQRVPAQLQVVKGRQGSILRYVEQPVSV